MEDKKLFSDLVPGSLVKCPSFPEWGIGQIQSCLLHKATINFENVGKKVIDLRIIEVIIF
mgnify:CR=1 FL=1